MVNTTVAKTSITTRSTRREIHLLAIVEANSVTGPAKNLLEFCRLSRNLEVGPTIKVSIVTFVRASANVPIEQLRNEFIDKAFQDGIQVHCVRERFAFDPKVIGDLRRTVDRLAPDIIQTHALKAHFLVRLCGACKRRAWVAFHHGYIKTYWRAVVRQSDRWSLRGASQVVTVCAPFVRQLCGRGIARDKIMVLHNAIDPDWLGARREDEALVLNQWHKDASVASSQEKLILAVGRLSREKAFPDLVAAILCLKDIRPELVLRLAILGEGPEQQAIAEAVHRAGLDDRVQLLGHVRDVRPYYRTADVLVISSLSEGSPNVLLEAMAAGVPVVATAVGGIPEIVADSGSVLLVPPRNPEALARAINRLLTDQSLAEANATRARELIKIRYSPLSRTHALIKLYERLSIITEPNAAEVAEEQLAPR